jgi:hypothetical protein
MALIWLRLLFLEPHVSAFSVAVDARPDLHLHAHLVGLHQPPLDPLVILALGGFRHLWLVESPAESSRGGKT